MHEMISRQRRSVSPRLDHAASDRHRRRRSPADRDRPRHSHDRERCSTQPRDVTLPFRQRPLDKHDLKTYEPLFAEYLSIQKQIDLATLSGGEVKGRWKSFTGKWNRGELAQGWYDPAFLQRTIERADDGTSVAPEAPRITRRIEQRSRPDGGSDDDEDGDNDDLGPKLPTDLSEDTTRSRQGPAVPSLQDLQYKRELDDDEHEAKQAQLRQERKLERQADRERLDELVPRADPGSRDRRLEKKREATGVNRSFAEARESGAADIADDDLMGDAEDGLDAYKARVKKQERQKNEREIRREEVLRARAAEREERLAEHRRKEEKTMATLRALAEQRYGNPTG